MSLNDYEPTARMIDDTPRPRAAQDTAAQKRRTTNDDGRTTDDPPAAHRAPRQIALVAIGVFSVIGVLALAVFQPGMHGVPLKISPLPAQAFEKEAIISPPASPEARTAIPTVPPPTFTPIPAAPPVAAPVEDAQTGQGMTLNTDGDDWQPEATATPESPEPPTPPVPTAWPTSAPVAIPDFEKPDIRGTCQFVGCLGAKAVALERANACHALYWQYGDADAETISEPDLSAVRACVWEGLYK